MKTALLILTLIVFTTGCSLTAMMVPVEGPLSALRPPPVIEMKADGILGNSGKVTFLMPGHDACVGRWSAASGASVAVAGGSLLSQYQTTHLSGYAVTSGGRSPGVALVVCQSGLSVQLEFVTGEGHGFGIGKDSDGNIYRFVF